MPKLAYFVNVFRAALVADLFILRPTEMWLINMREKIRGTAGQPKPAE